MNINLLEEINKPENENRIITIGNKDEDVYAFTILAKLITYDYVFVRVFDMPKLLSKTSYIYNTLLQYGIVRLVKPERMEKQNHNGKVEVVIFKWEIIPRIKSWRETLRKDDFLTMG